MLVKDVAGKNDLMSPELLSNRGKMHIRTFTVIALPIARLTTLRASAAPLLRQKTNTVGNKQGANTLQSTHLFLEHQSIA